MTLQDAINHYIAWRQAHGAKYKSSSMILHLFLKSVDGETNCNAVTTAQVLRFLAGKGPLTRHRENKHGALAGFYRYAISRGYVTRSPLPDNEPKPPASAPPHIYSRDELRRLFDIDAMLVSRRRAVQLDAATFRTLLVLLYGSGLRVGEAIRLTLADVDLPGAVLTISGTKFYKSRLVPIGPDLTHVLKTYMPLRTIRSLPQGQGSFFLANRDGTPLASSTIQSAFDNLRRIAGIHGAKGARQSPRLHDLRHSFAVHRMTDWYREGADVQRLLPVLSTYLGHTDLAGTQVYLSMTPELLQQASSRFERYASGGSDA
jgi:site-specific recombinase XerD